MNYISGAFRYVSGAETEKQVEVKRLVERIKSSSLAQDRRTAIVTLSDLAKQSPQHQSEIGELGIKVFYAILEQDKHYDANLRACIDLLISICSVLEYKQPSENENGALTNDPTLGNEQRKTKWERESAGAASTNIDVFLGLPNSISFVLEHLGHDDYHVRCATLELLTAMAGNSLQTLQAAILDTTLGVGKICDLLDDKQHVVRSNTVMLLSVLCRDSPEVSKIVSFSGVPEKLFDLVDRMWAKEVDVTLEHPGPDNGDDFEDENLESAIVVQDVLELIASLIKCSETTRTALRESGCISRLVAVLSRTAQQIGMTGTGSFSNGGGGMRMAVLKQTSKNVSLCLENLNFLLQGDPKEVKLITAELTSTDVFKKVALIAFSNYLEDNGKGSLELAKLRLTSFQTLSSLLKAHRDFKVQFHTSHCVSALGESSTPQMSTLSVMLHDRSASLRAAAFVTLRESLLQDSSGVPSPALVNAITGASGSMSSGPGSSADLEVDEEEEHSIAISPKFFFNLAEALKDALTLHPKSSDEAGLFYCSLLLSWVTNRTQGARERLLASYAHNAGSLLFSQIMRVLGNAHRSQASTVVRVSLLSLICSWLYKSPTAVSTFLSSAMHLPLIVDMQRSSSKSDDLSVHMKGLCAVLLGICLEIADGGNATGGEGDFISGGGGPSMVIPRGTISDAIRNHIGVTAFTAYLSELKSSKICAEPLSSKGYWDLATSLSAEEYTGGFLSEKGDLGHGAWYDEHLASLIDDVHAQIGARALELLSHPNNDQTSSLNAEQDPTWNANTVPNGTYGMLLNDAARNEVHDSYKELIKDQDERLSAAQERIQKLESELREASSKIITIEKGSISSVSYSDEQANTNDAGVSKALKRQRRDYAQRNDGPFQATSNSKHETSFFHEQNFTPTSINENQETQMADQLYSHIDKESELGASAVSHLQQQLQDMRTVCEHLEQKVSEAYRSRDDWRMKAEANSTAVAEEQHRSKSLAKTIEELNQVVVTLKAGTESQSDELSSAHHRISELEGRCAELSAMRRNTEEELSSLRDEVALRTEQTIDLSGKLYEAEEANALVEEARSQRAIHSSVINLNLESFEDHSDSRTGALSQTTLSPLSFSFHSATASTVDSDKGESMLRLREEIQAQEDVIRSLRIQLARSLEKDAVKDITSLELTADDLSSDSKDSRESRSISKSVVGQLYAKDRTCADRLLLRRPESDFIQDITEVIIGDSLNNILLDVALYTTEYFGESLEAVRLASKESEIAIRKDARQLEVELVELKALLREALQSARKSCNELSSTEVVLRALHADRAAMQNKMKDLEVELRKTEAKLSLQHSRKLAADESRKVFAENQDLRNRASELQRKTSHLSKQLETLVREKDKTCNELATAKNEIEKLKAANIQNVAGFKAKMEAISNRHRLESTKTRLHLDALRQDFLNAIAVEHQGNSRYQEQIQEYIGDIASFSSSLCVVNAALNVTAEALDVESRRNNSLSYQLAAEVLSSSSIKETVKEQSFAIAESKNIQNATESVLKEKISDLEQSLCALEEEMAVRQKLHELKMGDLENSLRRANATIDATKRLYEASEASARASSEKEAAALDAVKAELSSVIENSRKKSQEFSDLERRHKELQDDNNAVVASLNQKLSESLSMLESLNVERDDAFSELSKLRDNVQSLRELQQEYKEKLDFAQSSIEEKENSISSLNAEQNILKDDIAKLEDAVSAKAKSLASQAEVLQELKVSLSQERASVAKLTENHEDLSVANTSLSAANRQLEEEKSDISKRLQEAEEGRINSEQDNSELRVWVTELEMKAADLQQAVMDFEEVEASLNEALLANKEAESVNETLSEELRQLKLELANVTAASRAAIREKSEAEEACNLSHLRVDELESRLEAIRGEHLEKLLGLEEAMRRSAARCAELESALATAERKIAENGKLSDKLYKADIEISQKSKEISGLRARAESAEEALELMKQQANALTQELEDFQSKSHENAFHSLEADHEELLVCLAEMEMECSNLKKELGRV